MNAGSSRESFAPIGSNLPDYDNYFCRDCRHIVHVRKGSPGFRECPTPGCRRPTGFGECARVLRPSTLRGELCIRHDPERLGDSRRSNVPR